MSTVMRSYITGIHTGVVFRGKLSEGVRDVVFRGRAGTHFSKR